MEEEEVRTEEQIDENEVRQSGEPDFTVAPTEPVYNSGDNSECRDKVTYYYERALRNFEYTSA